MLASSSSYIGSKNPVTILVMVALIGGFAVFAKSWVGNLPEPVSTEFAKAKVVALEKKSMKSIGKTGINNTTSYMFAVLELANGKTFRTFVPQPYPRIGEELQVKVTTFDDGSQQAAAIREL